MKCSQQIPHNTDSVKAYKLLRIGYFGHINQVCDGMLAQKWQTYRMTTVTLTHVHQGLIKVYEIFIQRQLNTHSSYFMTWTMQSWSTPPKVLRFFLGGGGGSLSHTHLLGLFPSNNFGPDKTLKSFPYLICLVYNTEKCKGSVNGNTCNCIDLTACILDSFFPLGYQKTCQMLARKLNSQLSIRKIDYWLANMQLQKIPPSASDW